MTKQQERAKHLYDEGWYLTEIGAAMGLSKQRVDQVLKRAGVPRLSARARGRVFKLDGLKQYKIFLPDDVRRALEKHAAGSTLSSVVEESLRKSLSCY